jgi:hypothetical protein
MGDKFDSITYEYGAMPHRMLNVKMFSKCDNEKAHRKYRCRCTFIMFSQQKTVCCISYEKPTCLGYFQLPHPHITPLRHFLIHILHRYVTFSSTYYTVTSLPHPHITPLRHFLIHILHLCVSSSFACYTDTSLPTLRFSSATPSTNLFKITHNNRYINPLLKCFQHIHA